MLPCLSSDRFRIITSSSSSHHHHHDLPLTGHRRQAKNKMQSLQYSSLATASEEDDPSPIGERQKIPMRIFFNNIRYVFKYDELGREIVQIALPAALALMADPIASLIDTAFIGQIGPVELAAVGVSIALFNQVSKVAIFPLVSITTSFVAEEDAVCSTSYTSHESEYSKVPMNADSEEMELTPLKSDHFGKKMLKTLRAYFQTVPFMKTVQSSVFAESGTDDIELLPVTCNRSKLETTVGKRHIPSASSALIIGSILGLLETVFLISGARPLLNFMGVNSESPMLSPALKYLTLRSLGAPAILLSLAMQGVFRGFKDTKTPLYASVAGDVTNIILDPICIFVFRLGISGAAIAHVASQYLISIILLWRLRQKVDLVPPSAKHLKLGRFLKNGFLLLMRVIAATFCVTLAASMAARLGSTQMAAFQVCLQVWLASSLLADGLAVAGQAILASAFARNDFERASATVSRVLQLALVLGLVLAAVLGFGLQFGAKLFSKDADVLRVIAIGVPFVALTQPINALAFVFDGVNFGASDFFYAAYSMVALAVVSILFLFTLSSTHGFIGIWVALTFYMSLRALAGFSRIATGTGPWKFLWR